MIDGIRGRKLRNPCRTVLFFLVSVCLFEVDLGLAEGLNLEGLALLRFKERVLEDPYNALASWNGGGDGADPCSWFGVECFEGRVVALNLRDLCLRGTLAPDLGNLAHMRSINLRNNSFYGTIPGEIVELKELEVLDLGYNGFALPLPFELLNTLPFVAILDNNRFLDGAVSQLYKKLVLSRNQAEENQPNGASVGATCNDKFVSQNIGQPMDYVQRNRRLLQATHALKGAKTDIKKVFAPSSPVNSPAPSPSRFPQRSPNEPRKPPKEQEPPLKPHSSSTTKRLDHPPPRPPIKPIKPISSPKVSPSPAPSPSPMISPSRPPSPMISPSRPPSPTPAPSPSPTSMQKAYSPAPAPAVKKKKASLVEIPVVLSPVSSISSPKSSPALNSSSKAGKSHRVVVWSSIAGGSLVFVLSVVVVITCRSGNVVPVKPWATGLSGQLQKAFVSGVPKLKRSELETACEDFSNIIGTLTDSTVYKGTLSSGVEIAVVSSLVKSRQHWSRNLESQFRKKIETLSKVNHKNFVNLIGYCEEEKPFTRMMVFEYAPNGTLFEHLHIKEAERLDWRMRLRIVMGMAYCLEQMHHLRPPIPHRDLQSSSVYLSEDYAAKLSDFSFWTEVTPDKLRSPSMQLLEASMADKESNIHSFGLLLLEVVTGRIPYDSRDGAVEDWVFDCLRADHVPGDIIDPTLTTFQEENIETMFEIVKDCVNPDPRGRPEIREVVLRLKAVTGLESEAATPRLSPLWWAELEVLTSESV